MAVFRVERTGDYTVMSNFHLKDKRLSLKAKGLLSQMLSLPDDWDYTLSGLSYINRESKDAIRSAVNELETAGYIRRRQTTDASGKFAANEYTIFERPIEGEPMLDKPLSENPITVNPSAVNPLPENPTQLNTKKSNTQKQNTHGSNTDSIPFRKTAAAIPPERKGRDAMSVTEIENYRELRAVGRNGLCQTKDHPDLWCGLSSRDCTLPLFEAGQLSHRVCHGLSAKEHHPGTQHQAVPACSAVQRSYHHE